MLKIFFRCEKGFGSKIVLMSVFVTLVDSPNLTGRNL